MNFLGDLHLFVLGLRQVAPAAAEHKKVQSTTTCVPCPGPDAAVRMVVPRNRINGKKHRESSKECVTLIYSNGDSWIYFLIQHDDLTSVVVRMYQHLVTAFFPHGALTWLNLYQPRTLAGYLCDTAKHLYLTNEIVNFQEKGG